MITKRIDQLTYADIEHLVEMKIPESRELDYKRDLPGRTDNEVKEFMADVSSFANASGGHLVYGIATAKDNGKNTAIPDSISGVGNVNVEEVQNRLDDLIRSCIQPRIIGFHVRAISEEGKPTVVVIHIPRSWNAPHMISKGASKFYSRTSTGKQPLDVTEIRHAFAMSESVGEKIKAFRDERIGRILAGDAAVPLLSGATVVLHMIPLLSFAERNMLDMQVLDGAGDLIKLINSHSHPDRYRTFDGICASGRMRNGTGGYTLLFRNGAIEAVDTYLLQYNEKDGSGKQITSRAFEESIISAANNLYDIVKTLGIAPPVFCFLTLLNVRGFFCSYKNSQPPDPLPFDRDHLFMPNILVEDAETPADKFLHPAFDIIWQSGGRSGSPFYGDDGRWA